jgi:hypothetical protein
MLPPLLLLLLLSMVRMDDDDSHDQNASYLEAQVGADAGVIQEGVHQLHHRVPMPHPGNEQKTVKSNKGKLGSSRRYGGLVCVRARSFTPPAVLEHTG